MSRRVSEAPATARPLLSRIVPFNCAKLTVACAKARGVEPTVKATATHRTSVERSFMTIPLLTASKQFVMLIGNGGIWDLGSKRLGRDVARTKTGSLRPSPNDFSQKGRYFPRAHQTFCESMV